MNKIILALFIFISASVVQANEGDVDYLSLAQLLVKDGNYARAEKTLNKVSVDEKKQPLYLSLQGMIFLNKGMFVDSVFYFTKSIEVGLKEKEVYLYLAEALVQLKKYEQANSSLEKLSKEYKSKLPYHLVKAEILWRTGSKDLAWQTLNKAQQLNLSQTVLSKRKFQYFLEEGLYQSAFDLSFQLIRDSERFADVLAMGSQLRLSKQYDLSLKILQHLQVLRPDNDVVALEMAQNYLALESAFSAALILEKAAKHNNSLAFEAGELLRKVGKSYRAQFLNLSTLDPQKRLKQKLTLYLEEDDYFSLTFLVPQLNRHQLLEDQEIQYAVAYSFFRTGDFKKSENYLKNIVSEDLFDKSVELRREIDHCKSEKWACSETI